MFGHIRCKVRKDPDTIRNLPDPDIVSGSYNLICGFYNRFIVSCLYYPVQYIWLYSMQRRKDPDTSRNLPDPDIVSVSYKRGFYNRFIVSRLYYPVQRRTYPDLRFIVFQVRILVSGFIFRIFCVI